MDDFEHYAPGTVLEKEGGFQLWGGNANVSALDDASGHGPYEGTDLAGLTVTVGPDQFLTSDQELSIYDDVVFSALDTTSVELNPARAGQSFKVYPNPASSTLNIIHEGISIDTLNFCLCQARNYYPGHWNYLTLELISQRASMDYT
jgi:hypothetical protein